MNDMTGRFRPSQPARVPRAFVLVNDGAGKSFSWEVTPPIGESHLVSFRVTMRLDYALEISDAIVTKE